MDNKKVEERLLSIGGIRWKTSKEDKIYIECCKNCKIWWDVNLSLFFYEGKKEKCKNRINELKKFVSE